VWPFRARFNARIRVVAASGKPGTPLFPKLIPLFFRVLRGSLMLALLAPWSDAMRHMRCSFHSKTFLWLIPGSQSFF
jgi:hypothetical protein